MLNPYQYRTGSQFEELKRLHFLGLISSHFSKKSNEYKIATFEDIEKIKDHKKYSQEMEKKLNELGKEGWIFAYRFNTLDSRNNTIINYVFHREIIHSSIKHIDHFYRAAFDCYPEVGKDLIYKSNISDNLKEKLIKRLEELEIEEEELIAMRRNYIDHHISRGSYSKSLIFRLCRYHLANRLRREFSLSRKESDEINFALLRQYGIYLPEASELGLNFEEYE